MEELDLNTQVVNYYMSNFTITMPFGASMGGTRKHGGLDLANGRKGDSVKSLTDGKVIAAYYSPTGGYMVNVQQDDDTVVKYMHMQVDLDVGNGDEVVAGQQLGKVGNSGRSTGAHLHLQVEKNGKTIDPLQCI